MHIKWGKTVRERETSSDKTRLPHVDLLPPSSRRRGRGGRDGEEEDHDDNLRAKVSLGLSPPQILQEGSSPLMAC